MHTKENANNVLQAEEKWSHTEAQRCRKERATEKINFRENQINVDCITNSNTVLWGRKHIKITTCDDKAQKFVRVLNKVKMS